MAQARPTPPVLRAAYLKQHPHSEPKWQEIAGTANPAEALYRKLHDDSRFISKGEFAHDVAIAIQKGASLVVPPYLTTAITRVLDGPGEPDASLSEQQAALVHADGNTFAEACPGAGKTRAIVARFHRRVAEEPRKGIALVSFTNGAIDEVRKRCGEQAEALLAPNFVGTFDGFINRFITRPLYVQQYGQTPGFSESWAGLKLASFGVPAMDPKASFQLDWFELDWCLRATLKEEGVPCRSRWMLEGLAHRPAERSRGTRPPGAPLARQHRDRQLRGLPGTRGGLPQTGRKPRAVRHAARGPVQRGHRR